MFKMTDFQRAIPLDSTKWTRTSNLITSVSFSILYTMVWLLLINKKKVDYPLLVAHKIYDFEQIYEGNIHLVLETPIL